MKPRLLVVDDDAAYRRSVVALLSDTYQVAEAADGPAAVSALAQPFDAILMDVRMPGIQGVDLVEVLRSRGEDTPILMISGFGTVDTAVRALHVGADDFLTKPVEPSLLRDRIRRLVRDRPARREGGHRLVGESAAIEAVRRDIGRVGPTDASVLVIGETGTGKELVARAVHEASPRAGRPFVAVNSAGLADSLVESHLFGHVRGAFTGADRDRTGLFEAADGGTIFLDEIGDMSASAQKRLLRVLQEREVVPVGAVEARRIDVRVVAATHRDPDDEISAGRFREDLLYRLDVFRIELPPLRGRPGDIPLLVSHFFGGGADVGPQLAPPVVERLLEHEWPGNVRQLFSVLESARIRAEGGRIHLHHLPAEIRGSTGSVPSWNSRDESAVREAILAALEQASGSRTHAARLLGIGRTTLWRRMKELGIGED